MGVLDFIKKRLQDVQDNANELKNTAIQTVKNDAAAVGRVAIQPVKDLAKVTNTAAAGVQGVGGLINAGGHALIGQGDKAKLIIKDTNRIMDDTLLHGALNAGSLLTPQQARSSGGGLDSLKKDFVKPLAEGVSYTAPFATPEIKAGSAAVRVGGDILLNGAVGGGASAAKQYADNGKVDLKQLAMDAAVNGATAGVIGGAPIAAKAAGKRGIEAATSKPFRKVSPEELDALRRFQANKESFDIKDADIAVQKRLSKQYGEGENDTTIVDTILNARRNYDIKMSKQKAAAGKAVDQVKQFARDHPLGLSMKAVDDAGNPVSAFTGKPRLTESRALQDQLPTADRVAAAQQPIDNITKEYGGMLRSMDVGARGGVIVPNGDGEFLRVSEHTPFYRQYFDENGRAPSKAAFNQEAERQLTAGRADSMAQQEYGAAVDQKNAIQQAGAEADAIAANPEFPADLPVPSGNGAVRERSVTLNTRERGDLPADFKEGVDPQTYQQTTNQGAIDNANSRVNNLGFEQTLQDVQDHLDSGKIVSDAETAAVQKLVSELAASGDKVKADTGYRLLDQLAQRLTEQGQGNQAARILYEQTPDGLRYAANRTLVKSGALKDLSDDQISKVREVVEETISRVKQADDGLQAAKQALDQATENANYTTAKAKQATESGTNRIDAKKARDAAETAAKELKKAEKAVDAAQNKRNKAVNDTKEVVAQQLPDDLIKKGLNIWTAGLISGGKTMTGAPFSNAVTAVGNLTAKPIAAGLDRLKAGRNGARNNTLVNPLLYGKGFVEGIPKAYNVLKTGIDDREPVRIQQDMARETNYKTLPGKVVGGAANSVFRLMSALDRPFYEGQKRMGVAELEKLNRMNEGRPGAIKFGDDVAEKEARESVLDFDTLLSKVASGVKRTVDKNDDAFSRGIGKVAAQVNSPFVRVPTAGLAKMVDYSPAGLPVHVARQLANKAWGDQKTFNWRDFNRAVGESATGTGVVVLGYQMAKSANVSGEYPSNDPKEAARWQAEGITPNSIKIGDKWIGLNYFGPVGSLIQQGRRFFESGKKGNSLPQQTLDSQGGVFRDALNQSYLQGVNSSLEAAKDPERALKGYTNGLAGTVVPAIVNDVANATDEFKRQVNGPIDAIKNRIPGLRTDLNQKQDVYGNPIERQTSAVGSAVNPARPSDERRTPVTDEVSRLHEVDKNNKDLQVTPTAVQKTIQVEGNTVKLNDQQRYDLQTSTGKAIESAWGKLIKTDAYKGLSDADKAQALNNLRQDVTSVETRKYVTDNNLATYGKKLSKQQQKVASGKADISKYASSIADGGDDATSIADGISNRSKTILTAYNDMDTKDRAKKAATQNDFEYQYMQAKYENDKAKGGLSGVDDVKAKNGLAKAKIGAGYSKDVRELYGLSRDDIASYLATAKNGAQLADQLAAYDRALTTAGINSKLKFKNGAATAVAGATPKGGRGSKSLRTVSISKGSILKGGNRRQTYRVSQLPGLKAGRASYKTAKIATNADSKLKARA